MRQSVLLDDPDRQLQEALNLNVTSQNYMIIGSAQCGKTNVLQTIIRSIADNYAPSEVNMYMIDFGSMILKNFAELNHCGGVVCVSDDEKLKNLFKLLNTEVKNRKERFAEAGVSSFVAYKETGKTDLSQIIVFIDNLTRFKGNVSSGSGLSASIVQRWYCSRNFICCCERTDFGHRISLFK